MLLLTINHPLQCLSNPFQFSQAQCCREEDSCNPALYVEQAFVLVHGHRSQPCGCGFAKPACHVEELKLHKKVITPLVMSCSTRSHNIACRLVDRKDLYNSCEYNHEHAANTKMQSLRSQPGIVMRVSHPHLAKIISTLICANTWSGSGAKEHMWAGQERQSVVAFFSKETLFPSCVGIAPHLEAGGAPFEGSSAHWTNCCCPHGNSSCMEFNRCGRAHCHLLRWFSAIDESAHTAEITNHSAHLMCSCDPSNQENRQTHWRNSECHYR